MDDGLPEGDTCFFRTNKGSIYDTHSTIRFVTSHITIICTYSYCELAYLWGNHFLDIFSTVSTSI